MLRWMFSVLVLMAVYHSRGQDQVNNLYRDSIISLYCPVCKARSTSGRITYNADQPFLPFHIAHNLMCQNRPEEAFSFLTKAMTYALKTDNKTILYFSYLLKAALFYRKNLPAETLAAYKLAIAIGKKHNFPLLTESYIGAGLVNFDEKRYDSAYRYFLFAERRLSPSSPVVLKKNLFCNLALYYSRIKDYKSAEKYHLQSLAIEQQLGNAYGIAQSYLNIGSLYYEQYRDDLAVRYYKRCLCIARQHKYYRVQQYALMNLTAIMFDGKKYRLAFNFLKEATALKDTLYGRDRIVGVLNQQKKYEVSQKQTEIVQLQNEKTILEAKTKQQELEKKIYLTGGISLFALIGAIATAYKQKVISNRKIVAQKDELDRLNQTKDQLFSIIAHDLRSPVHSLNCHTTQLKELLHQHNIEKAACMSERIERISCSTYALLNNLLHWSLSQTGQLSFVPERLKAKAIVDQVCYDYAAIAASKQVALENDIPENLFLSGDINSVKIIVRNLVDNAIKYTPENGRVIIYAARTGSSCELTVRDSGMGMDEQTIQALMNNENKRIQRDTYGNRSTGLGLMLSRSMAIQNGGRLQITSSKGEGTCIIVNLPLASHYE